MRRPTRAVLLAALLLALPSPSAGQAGARPAARAVAPARPVAPAAARAEFRAFWAAFRGAALAGDTVRVARLTRFPFRTRGTSDGDPVRQVARARFAALFVGPLLDSDPGLAAAPETMRALIERTSVPDDRAVDPGGLRARVGDFVFERQRRSARSAVERWRFVMAYVDD